MTKYFNLQFFKHSNSSVHLTVSITNRPISHNSGKHRHCILYDSCWVSVDKSEIRWDMDSTNLSRSSLMVNGIIRGIFATLGKLNVQEELNKSANRLFNLAPGNSLSLEYEFYC